MANVIQKALGNLISRGMGGFSSFGVREPSDGRVRTISPRQAMTCGAVSTSIRIVAGTVAQLEFVSSDMAVNSGLMRPNKFQSRMQFFHGLVHDLVLHGKACIRYERMGSTLMLAALDPEKVEAAPDTDIFNPTWQDYGTGEMFGVDQLIVIRDGGGHDVALQSRVQSVASEITALLEANKLIADTFRKGAAINITASFEGGVGQKVLDDFRKQVEALYSSEGGNRGSSVLAARGVDFKSHKGLTPADADLRELRTDLVREISSAIGAPPFQAGGSGQEKYSNMKERNSIFAKDTIIPIVENIKQTLSTGLGAMIECDTTKLLEGDQASQVAAGVQACGGAYLTPNEVRAQYGHGEIDGGEVLRSNQLSDAQANSTPDRRGENEGEDET